MTFSHPYGTYNVEGSFNNWFETNITGQGLPSWMPSARVVFGWDEETPIISGYSGAAFSVAHLGNEPIQEYQGRRVGAGAVGHTREGMVDVSCWVSKQQAGNAYTQRQRQMADMVHHLFASAREFEITDLYGSLSAPTGIGALVRLQGAAEVDVAPDPNPDIQRRRFLVTYSWVERVTG